MIFAPTDPGPSRPTPPPRAGMATRIIEPNAGGTCKRHQLFADGCERCDEIIARRREIRTERVRRDIARNIMGAPGSGR